MARDVQYSVVMPAYNTENFIGMAIQSVLDQTVDCWELIIINDGSTDNTAKIASQSSDPRIKLYSTENKGISSARNKGIELAKGEFIIFFDSDDRLYPNALERLGNAIYQSNTIFAVYGESITISETGDIIGTGKKPLFNVRPSGQVLPYLLRKNFLLPSATLIRRNVLMESAGFITHIEIAEDWELFCRLAAQGLFHYIGGEPVVDYRLRSGSVRMIGNPHTLNKKRMQCIDAVFTNPEVTKQIDQKELRKIRCMAEASAFSSTACTALRAGDWKTASSYLLKSLKRNPFPIRIREVILFCCSLSRWLPYPVRRRLR